MLPIRAFIKVFLRAALLHGGSQSGKENSLNRSCARKLTHKRCLHLKFLSIMADVDIYDVGECQGVNE